jgi:hypothetical protein
LFLCLERVDVVACGVEGVDEAGEDVVCHWGVFRCLSVQVRMLCERLGM